MNKFRKVKRCLEFQARRVIHSLIQKYLNSCGGNFHTGKYGEKGKYIVLMSDEDYSTFQSLKYSERPIYEQTR